MSEEKCQKENVDGIKLIEKNLINYTLKEVI